MPDELENRVESLEGRVSGLEERLRVSEQDAAAARVLAGGADRDVAEIRSEIREFREQNTRLHNATRQDFADMRTRFDRLDAGVHEVVGMLNTLIERDDRG